MLLDESDTLYAGRIESFGQDHALIALSGEPDAIVVAAPLILAVGLIKGSRMDFLVEKAAELGATELVPLLCQRSVIRDPGAERFERWRRLAVAAVKQSLAAKRMVIHSPRSVAGLVREVSKETRAVVCSPAGLPFASVIQDTRPNALTVACGPEGGFAQEEMALMISAGYREVSLGANRLRTETAALAALSIAIGVRAEFAARG